MQTIYGRTLIIIAIGALTACGGGLTPGTNGASLAPTNAHAVQPDKKSKLLYVTDVGNNSVDVLTYPQGTLSQTLTGFSTPFGACADKKGDVYITDNYDEDVLEYAHGGSSPINTIYDENQNPTGCAIDPKSGDLAVAIEATTTQKSGYGGVNVYPKATGTPTFYSGSGIDYAWYCGYDDSGNLYVDGLSSSTTVLAELVKGGSSLTTISLPVTLYGPGGVKWDGKYVAVANEQSTVYEFSISGGKATKKGTTQLAKANSVYGIWLSGKDLLGANSNGGSVGVWKYPAGGNPKKTLTDGISSPLDVALSK